MAWNYNKPGYPAKYYHHVPKEAAPVAREDDYTDHGVWNAVHDAAQLRGKDPDEARKIADRVVADADKGRRYDQVQVDDARRKRRRRLMENVAGWSALASVLGGIATGVYFIVAAQQDNFAGYGPDRVLEHGQVAVSAWYGLDNAPDQLRVTGKRHARLYGQDAWRVDYRTSDGEKVCAWVWLHGQAVPGSHYGPDDYWKVGEGAAC